MKRIVENFREFMDLASINQGPDGWRIYGSNPRPKKKEPNRKALPKMEDFINSLRRRHQKK